MKKRSSVSSKKPVHNGSLKKIVASSMCSVSLIKLVGTNKNACFTISKNNFLKNQSLKLCVSSIQNVRNLDVLLNTKKLLKNLKIRDSTKLKIKNHFLEVQKPLWFVSSDKNVKDLIVDLAILKDRIETNKMWWIDFKIKNKSNQKGNYINHISKILFKDLSKLNQGGHKISIV